MADKAGKIRAESEAEGQQEQSEIANSAKQEAERNLRIEQGRRRQVVNQTDIESPVFWPPQQGRE